MEPILTAGNLWQDQLADRLDRPDSVPEQYQHLIADDQQRVKAILAVPIPEKAHILDVGCSDLALTERIVAHHQPTRWTATDVELRDERIVRWDAREPWPYEPVWFDAIYCCEMLEHLTDDDAWRAMAQMMKLLRPKGLFVCTVPNKDCDEAYVAGCRDRWRWPDHRSAWNAAKLRALLLDFCHPMFYPIYPTDHAYKGIWLLAVGTRMK